MIRTTGPIRSRLAACTVAALLLAGCASSIEDGGDIAAKRRILQNRQERERTMQQNWIGRSQQELFQAYGRPTTVLGLPGGRLPLSVIIVYRDIDLDSDCIDAFVVMIEGDEQVWNYFCR